VFGVVYSFGVFLQPVAKEFHADPAETSAFFSITSVVYYALGAFAGRAADRLGPRIVIATGAATLGPGLCLTALVDRIWLGYLTYGLGVGIGGACCYVPTLAVVGHWFERHRNTALGIAATGTGAGTMAAPPVAAAALVSLIGGTSILGRLVLSPMGDRIGVIRLFKATVLLRAVSYAKWLLWSSYFGLAVFGIVLGVNHGSRIAAVPAVLIELFGMGGLGTTLGVFFTATGVAALLGPTLAGVAVELSGGYRGGILFALATGLLGFAVIIPVGSQSFDARRSDLP
jgi:MFS family permease